jgi:hypothetical protein
LLIQQEGGVGTPLTEKLAGWLKIEAGKSRKQKRTIKQLHADLVTLGFTGSYARVAAFARRWKADRQREQQTTGRGTFVPLHFDPGEAFQFDWSEDFAVLGGERPKADIRQPSVMPQSQPALPPFAARVKSGEGRTHCLRDQTTL